MLYKMKKPPILILFRFAILFEILWGAQAWFTWWISDSRVLQYVVAFIIAFIAYKYKSRLKIRLNTSPTIMLAMLSYTIGVMFFNRGSIPSLVEVAFTLYTLWVVISDKENTKGHLQFVCKGLAIILIPGLILFLGKGYIPTIGLIIQKGDSGAYIFINQFFLIYRTVEWDSLSANRFHSVFLEPGYLGAMLSFMMFAVKYDFSKWYTKTLLVAQLISLSLAGYIITFVGYILYLLSEGRNLKKIILFAIFVPIVYIAAINYNNGNNYINDAIISRLQFDEEKGIEGNNRTGAGTDFYYNQAVENGDIWMGLGAERVKQINGGSSYSAGYDDNIRGAGYKVFFVTNGVICAIFFLLFYIFIAKATAPSKMFIRTSFIFLIVLTFIQAAYPTSASWIYPFTLGLLYYNQKSRVI